MIDIACSYCQDRRRALEALLVERERAFVLEALTVALAFLLTLLA